MQSEFLYGKLGEGAEDMSQPKWGTSTRSHSPCVPSTCPLFWINSRIDIRTAAALSTGSSRYRRSHRFS